MRPVVALRPTVSTWLLLLSSPSAILLGAVLLYLRDDWSLVCGLVCIAVGVSSFARSAQVLWKHQGFRSEFPYQAQDTFISNDVSWAPATLHSGLSHQPGWIVVRQGWVAFLPSGASTNLIAGVALLAAPVPVVRLHLGVLVYDFAGAAQQGPHAFDQTVLALAHANGRVLNANEGDIVRTRKGKGVMFRADEKTFILCDAVFPEPLLAGWVTRQTPFNARETAKVFAIITSIPLMLGAAGGTIAYFSGESLAMICVGVGFWWSLVVVGWIGYFVAYRRSKRMTVSPTNARNDKRGSGP
jgi:hypothetical protein